MPAAPSSLRPPHSKRCLAASALLTRQHGRLTYGASLRTRSCSRDHAGGALLTRQHGSLTYGASLRTRSCSRGHAGGALLTRQHGRHSPAACWRYRRASATPLLRTRQPLLRTRQPLLRTRQPLSRKFGYLQELLLRTRVSARRMPHSPAFAAHPHRRHTGPATRKAAEPVRGTCSVTSRRPCRRRRRRRRGSSGS